MKKKDNETYTSVKLSHLEKLTFRQKKKTNGIITFIFLIKFLFEVG